MTYKEKLNRLPIDIREEISRKLTKEHVIFYIREILEINGALYSQSPIIATCFMCETDHKFHDFTMTFADCLDYLEENK